MNKMYQATPIFSYTLNTSSVQKNTHSQLTTMTKLKEEMTKFRMAKRVELKFLTVCKMCMEIRTQYDIIGSYIGRYTGYRIAKKLFLPTEACKGSEILNLYDLKLKCLHDAIEFLVHQISS